MFQGTVDFDPGPGTTQLASNGQGDIFLAKYTSAGGLVWARQMGGTGDDYASHGLEVDSAGNVYAITRFQGTSDFDPLAGTYYLNSAGSYDMAVVKLNSFGYLQWAGRMGGSGDDWGYDLAIDTSGNLYATGYFSNTADLDPGSGQANYNSAGGVDAFVAKINTSGNLIWAKQFGSGANDLSTGIALDSYGSVYFTGGYSANLDFDPGPGTATAVYWGGSGYDIFLCKLDSDGNYQWMTGTGSNFDELGNHGIAVDQGGNVYVAGRFTSSMPVGAGSLGPVGGKDIFILAYSSNGGFLEAYRFGGSGDEDNVALDFDPSDNLLVTSQYNSSFDLDPGSGTYNPPLSGGTDVFVAKYNRTSIQGWAWNDTDQDGLQEAGEVGIAGMKVALYASQDAIVGNGDDLALSSVITSADGSYGFAGFANYPGYYIKLDQDNVISGNIPTRFYTPSLQAQGTNTSLDNDINAAGYSEIVIVTPGVGKVLDAGLAEKAVAFKSWAVGGSGDDRQYGLAVDASGNTYVAGCFEGTVDFDPGPAQYNLTSAGYRDAYVAKYDSQGILLWVNRTGGASYDEAKALMLDAVGNVYVIGYFNGTVDVDPGPGTFNLTSASSLADGFLTKLDSAGQLIWARRLGGNTDSDYIYDVVAGPSNSVIVTGTFWGTVDFDPGPGLTNLSSQGQDDVFVARFSEAGSLDWARSFGSAGIEEGTDLAVDRSGNVILTGYFSGTVDFDPGLSTFNMTSAGDTDAYLCKMDSAGGFLWAGQIGGAGTDYRTAVAVDSSGNIYATGYFSGLADLDPSTGTLLANSAGGYDGYLCKLGPQGDFIWGHSLGGTGPDANGELVVDSADQVYVSSNFSNTVDYDPGVGESNKISAGVWDSVIYKLNSDGEYIWAFQFGGTGNDLVLSLAVDSLGTVTAGGHFETVADLNPGPGTLNVASQGSYDTFVLRVRQPRLLGRVWRDADADGVQNGNESGTANARVELFDAVDGIAGNSDDVLLEIATTDTNGQYQFVGPREAASYYVKVTGPAGVSGYSPPHVDFTTPGFGIESNLDSDVNRLGVSNLITLNALTPTICDAGLVEVPPSFLAWGVGGTGIDAGRAVCYDSAGNMFVAGLFETGDFDPSVGQTNLVGAGGNDIHVAKYSPSGELLWAFRAGASNSDYVNALEVDAQGSLYIGGAFQDTVDFDPGPGTFNLTSAGSWDGFLIKIDSTGSLVWAVKIGDSAGMDSIIDVHVVDSNAVYVGGNFTGTVDFDPGPGINERASNGLFDGFLALLDGQGHGVWAATLGGPANDMVESIAVDSASNVVITGYYRGTIDCDPGLGEINLPGDPLLDSAFVNKLDSSGNLLWANRIFSASGNIVGLAAVADSFNNVYTAGHFTGTGDFDPGPTTLSEASAGGTDLFITKLNSSGNLLWSLTRGGLGDDSIRWIDIDPDDNVIATGCFSESVDFDPGSSAYNLASAGGTDILLYKLDASGNMLWASGIGGAGDDSGAQVAVDGSGGVLIGGSFSQTIDCDPSSDVYLLTSLGGIDSFAGRYQQSSIQGRIWLDSDADGIQDVDENPLPGITVDLIDSVDGVVGNGDDQVVYTKTTTSEGNYRFELLTSSALYFVKVRLPQAVSGYTPPDYQFTLSGQGSSASDSDVDSTGITGLFQVQPAGSTIIDAGIVSASNAFHVWGIGGNGDDSGRAVCSDLAGNVIIAGQFQGTIDVDPSASVFTLTSLGSSDIFVAKYSPLGSLLWAARLGGTNDDRVSALGLDSSGNILLSGNFLGTADFDPGPGVSNLSSAGSWDVYVVQLSSAGSLNWARRIGNSGAENAGTGLALDTSGNVYVTGSFAGTVDFYPSGSIFNLTSAGGQDVFVLVLNNLGNFVWSKRMGGASLDEGSSVVLDATGNVLLTGSYNGTADFDPGPNTNNLTSKGAYDVYVCQLSPSGSLNWAISAGGTGSDYGRGVRVAPSGEVLVVGGYAGTADFDPGSGIANLVSAGLNDQFLLALESNGAFQWARSFGGSGDDLAYGLNVDQVGSVYILGSFSGTADFDPGPGSVALISAGSSDVSLVKLNGPDQLVWARQVGGVGNDVGLAIALDQGLNVWTTGSFSDTGDFDPRSGQYTLTGFAGTDLFVHRLAQSTFQGRVWDDVDADGIQDLGEPGLGGYAVELLDSVDAIAGNGNDISYGVYSTDDDGSYQLALPENDSQFYLEIRTPTGFSGNSPNYQVFTLHNQGGQPTKDSDVDNAGRSNLVQGKPGTFMFIDAGLHSANPSFQAWGIGGIGQDESQSVATDAQGNVYVVGWLEGTADFDPTAGVYELASSGARDAIVARYNSDGSLAWANLLGGSQDEQAAGIAIDSVGNLYVCGSFHGIADLDPSAGVFNVTSNGAMDAFLIKMDAAGSLLWVRTFGGPGNDMAGTGLAVDASGSVYLTGGFSGTSDFDPLVGTYSLTSQGDLDAFVLALDSTGQLLWARQFGGSGRDEGVGISVDLLGNVVTTGVYSGVANFEPGPDAMNLSSAGGLDVFVSKLNSAGEMIWTRSLGGPTADYSSRIAVDTLGSIYLAGTYSSTADFDPGSNVVSLISAGGSDQFLVKLDAGGSLIWARGLGGSGDDIGTGLTLDGEGNVYLGGSYSGVVDFDSGAGTFLLSSCGRSDSSIVKFDSTGKMRWAWSVGGTENDVSQGLALDTSGGIWTAGTFAGTADFDPGVGYYSIRSGGGNDLFVCKVMQPGIQGIVWLDGNNNGLRDSGEPVLPNAVVELFDSTGASLGARNTAADGSYRFDQPPTRNSYYLQVRPSAGIGLGFTSQGISDNPDRNSDVNAAGLSQQFVLSEGSSISLDAGLIGSISSYGSIWSVGSTSDEVGLSVVRSATGDHFVAGYFKGTVDFDPGPGNFVLTSAGGKDAFIARYNAGGAFLWARRLGGTGDDQANEVTLTSAGNLVVLGNFQATPNFGPGTASVNLISVGGQDIFVASLNAGGTLQWAKQVGGTSEDNGTDITVDPDGNLILTGSFAGTADFAPGPQERKLTSQGPRDGFVAKLAPNGDGVWAIRVGGNGGEDVASGVTIDAARDIYVTGAFSGVADFDPGADVYDLVSAGQNDVFLWKLHMSGGLVWARRAGGIGDDRGAGVVVQNGFITLVGTFTGTPDFDPGLNLVELPSAGGSDVFVWQLNPAGSLVWVRSLGGSQDDVAQALVADESGIYIAGEFQGTADFDPEAGQLLLASQGGSDAFLVKLNNAGQRQWARRLGGSEMDQGLGVALGSGGTVTLTGSSMSTSSFDPGDGEQLIAGAGQKDLFLALVNPLAGGGEVAPDGYEPNASKGFASSLGVINQQLLVNQLTLHNASDEDWFSLELTSAATIDHKVRIDFSQIQGDLTLELYSSTELLARSATVASFEQISLAGLTPGVYFVRVFGGLSPGYSLQFQVPPGYNPDSLEFDDTRETATILGALTDTTRRSGLTIHAANNQDWFRFTTQSEGTSSSFVRIDFRNELGDLNLVLCDSSGVVLRQASGATDFESISLVGLPAGTYFTRVSGRGEALSPLYTFTVEPPRPLLSDAYEPNGSRSFSSNLSTVTGRLEITGLSIHQASDEDWFQFATVARGAAGHGVRIDHSSNRGNLDLMLLDAAGTILATSATSADSEMITLADRPAGLYYVKVVGVQGATQASYQLILEAPAGAASQPDRLDQEGSGNNARGNATLVRSEGQDSLAGYQQLVDLNLHTGSDEDWFQFSTVARGALGHRLTLAYDPSGGNLDLELYKEDGTRLLISSGSNGTETLSLDEQPIAKYFARVFSPSGATSRYTLTFDTPTTTNQDAWTILVYMTADNLYQRAFDDINELEQAAARLPGSVNLAVYWDQSAALRTYATGSGAQAAWGTAGRALIVPDTDPGLVATPFDILPEQNSGSAATLTNFVTWARTKAPADRTALILWDHGSALRGTNYDRSDGQVADWLQPTELRQALAGLPRFDLLAFDACFQATLEQTYQLRSVADVVVGSQDIIPGDGFEYDQVFTLLETNPARISGEGLGTALVQAYATRYGPSGSGDTLSAIGTAETAALVAALAQFNVQLGSASENDLARLVGLAGSSMSHHRSADYIRDLGDYFRLIHNESSLVLALQTAAEAVLLEMDRAVLSRTADARGSSGLSLYLPALGSLDQVAILPGALNTYPSDFSEFIDASGWMAALTRLSNAGGSRPDGQDYYDRLNPTNGNDQPSTATDLRRLTIPVTISQLNLMSLVTRTEEDWFRFQVVGSAGLNLGISVTVQPGGGTLRVQLCDVEGNELISAATASTTTLTQANLVEGEATYYLRFFSDTGEVANYSFQISPPAGNAADWAGANDSQARAYELPVRSGEVLPGLSVEAASRDWFRFATPVLEVAELHQVEVDVTGTAPVLAQLRDEAGMVLAQVRGTGKLLLPYTQMGTGESYTLVVINSNAAAVPYSLGFAAGSYTSGLTFARDGFTSATGSAVSSASWTRTGTWTIQAQRARLGSASGRLLRNNFSAADAGVQTHFRFPASGNATATLLARARVVSGKLTAYEARLVRGANGVSVQLVRTVAGVSTTLRTEKLLPLLEGTLRLDVQGSGIRVMVQGIQRVLITDTTITASGLVGLAGTLNVTFDDFQATATGSALPLAIRGETASLGPAWQTLAGSFSVAGNRILAGSATSTAIYSAASVRDASLEAGFDLAPGQSMSLLLRNSGSGTTRSYYEARLTREGAVTKLQLVRVVAGKATNLRTVYSSASRGKLRFATQGSTLRVYLDGQLSLNIVDTTLKNPGLLGVSTSANTALTDLTA
ncbi:MAG: SdrD B-like domain-containing protein [Gemmataceae bacterium]